MEFVKSMCDTPRFKQFKTGGFFIIFSIAFAFFLFLQYGKGVTDPDSFYHLQMAKLMAESGIVRQFPYMEFTILKDSFADHHFFYHVLLIPFVYALGDQWGLAIATIFFASLFIAVFYWLLERLHVQRAFLYALFLLLIPGLVFRVNLAKASSLSLILLLL
ncbi:MAG: hypothetical protein HY602_00005, partial [Parcubacteria group bacterium]|nr:hypothetical protein [Parcubacteria group bacterium]